jgi:general secretion pathway protein K
MRNPMTSGGENGESGFALVLTLVVILVLSLVTETMTSWVVAAIDDALVNREEADAAQEIADAEAVVVYLLETRPMSFRGLEVLSTAQLKASPAREFAGPSQVAENYLRLDDRPYRLGEAVVRLQDARGLINLNFVSPDDLFALLGIFGVTAEDRGPLIDKLRDYTDADSLKRLNGAEARDYEDAGREPPANAPLRTPWEVRRILDWDKVPGINNEDTRWASLASTAPVAGFNINTAPREVLSLIPGMNAQAVDNVIARRQQQPIISALQFGQLTAMPIAEGPSRFAPYPSDSLVLTLATKQRPLERRIAIRQIPMSRDRPWTIDYDIVMPQAARGDDEATPNDLPTSGLLPATP